MCFTTPTNNSGIALFQGNGGGRIERKLHSEQYRDHGRGRRLGAEPDRSGCVSNTVLNNILYNYQAWRGSISIAQPALPGLQCDYNVVMSRFSVDSGDTRIDLPAWQNDGYDTHSLVATPADLFLNPTNDYHSRRTARR